MKDTTTLLVLMLAGLITGLAATVAYDRTADVQPSTPPPAIEQADRPRDPA